MELIDLGALRFDPDVHPVSPLQQPLEPDLALAWEKIDRGDLLLVVALTYLIWFVVIPLYRLA